MTTFDEIVKAYEDLSEDDKKKFHQTLKDRIDESVADQEREGDDEDSQDAKDRVDEALGAEKADIEKGEDEDEASEPESDDEGEGEDEPETTEDLEDHEAEDDAKAKTVEERLDKIEAMLMKIVGEDTEAAEDVEKKAKEVYGLGGGTFTPDEKGESKSKADVRKVLRNIGF